MPGRVHKLFTIDCEKSIDKWICLWYYNDCKKEKEFIFGRGGGSLVAEELGVDLLAEIPIATQEEDKILFDMQTIQGKTFLMIAKNYLDLKEL